MDPVKATLGALADATAEHFAGQPCAFTAVHMERDIYQLSVVVDGETGHFPVLSRTRPISGTEAEMRELADRLNGELDLSGDAVNELISQSMWGKRPSA